MSAEHRTSWRLLAGSFVAGALISMTYGTAAAVDDEDELAKKKPIDNIAPTQTYNAYCVKGSLGSAHACQSDNNTLTWYTESAGALGLEAEDRTVVKNTLEGLYEPTHLNLSRETAADTSGSSETDIIFEEGTVPGSDSGYTWCDDPISGSYRCDQTYIRIEGAGTITQGIVCHETGHAVGLVHRPDAFPKVTFTDARLGCMEKPTSNNSVLSKGDQDNINSVY